MHSNKFRENDGEHRLRSIAISVAMVLVTFFVLVPFALGGCGAPVDHLDNIHLTVWSSSDTKILEIDVAQVIRDSNGHALIYYLKDGSRGVVEGNYYTATPIGAENGTR